MDFIFGLKLLTMVEHSSWAASITVRGLSLEYGITPSLSRVNISRNCSCEIEQVKID